MAGRRMLGAVLTLLIEVLLLLLLLSLGTGKRPGVKDGSLTLINVQEVPEQPPEPSRPQPQQRAQQRPAAQQPTPEQPQAAAPAAAPPVIAIVPMNYQLPPSAAHPNTNPPAPAARPLYGPPDVRSPASRDSERVGTAPNGEPLYAAEWYQEPSDEMMRSYLSTAREPGWGLIACRTAPGYRVEDCVALAEYPEGSQINRSVLAMAWEFRVRPPRRGGESLVGAWVRIRIDYDLVRH